jgi:hypothetical protein
MDGQSMAICGHLWPSVAICGQLADGLAGGVDHRRLDPVTGRAAKISGKPVISESRVRRQKALKTVRMNTSATRRKIRVP